MDLIRRGLWPYGCQSDVLDIVAKWMSIWFVGLCRMSVIYIEICGCEAVSQKGRVLWLSGCQSDMLDFMAVRLSV